VKEKLRQYFENLEPTLLGLSGKITVDSISELGLGESNLNYLAIVNSKKFVFRVNMDPADTGKSRKEFNALKSVEGLRIAPKAFILDESEKHIDGTFLIMEYIEGTPLDKIETKLSTKIIRELARIVANLHSQEIGDVRNMLAKEKPTPDAWVSAVRKRIEYIRKRRRKYFERDGFDIMLDETLSKIRLVARGSEFRGVLRPGHGDICQQNLLVHNGELRLIDWEDFGLRDPASDIGIIFEGFGIEFTKEQEDEFLREYLNIRTDETLKERLKVFRPIIQFDQFVWAVMHVFEIGEKEMHEHFVERKNIQEHMDYARYCFDRCIKSGVIDKKWAEFRDLKMFPTY